MPKGGEHNIGYLVNQNARLLGSRLNQRLRELELTQREYALILSINAIKDRPVTATEVAEDLHTDRAGVARAVECAEAQGWVLTEPHPELRRARILALTPKAKAALPALLDIGHWTLECSLNGFTGEELDALRGYLQRMLRNLESP
jgi:DNA-binding MarR family transcriptional regulator